MKKKVMYVKPFAEKVYMENVLPLASGSTQGSGGAGGANDGGSGGGFNDDDDDDDPPGGGGGAKGYAWDEDDSASSTFAWKEFKKQ